MGVTGGVPSSCLAAVELQSQATARSRRHRSKGTDVAWRDRWRSHLWNKSFELLDTATASLFFFARPSASCSAPSSCGAVGWRRRGIDRAGRALAMQEKQPTRRGQSLITANFKSADQSIIVAEIEREWKRCRRPSRGLTDADGPLWSPAVDCQRPVGAHRRVSHAGHQLVQGRAGIPPADVDLTPTQGWQNAQFYQEPKGRPGTRLGIV
jgi:hypothetical protein